MLGFKNLKIRAKLLAGFVVVALVAAVVGAVGIQNMRSIDKADTVLYEENLVPIVYLSKMTETFQRIRVNLLLAITAQTPEDRAAALQKVTERRAEFAEAYEALGKIPMSPAVKEVYDELTAARKVYAEQFDILTKAIQAGQTAQAYELFKEEGDFGKASRAEQDVITKLVEVKDREAEEQSAKNTKKANTATVAMIIAIIAGMAIAIAFGMFLSAAIGKPLAGMTEAARRLSEGDVEVSLESESKDEIGMLAEAFNEMAANIKKQAGNAKKIAQGDLNVEITPRSDKDVLALSMRQVVEELRKLIDEANMLAEAAINGNLGVRGNAAGFEGGYRAIIEGMNRTMEAVAEPIKETAEALQVMAQKDLTVRVKGDYKGDYAKIKDAMNYTVDELNNVLSEINLSADQVGSGADQVAATSQNLSQGASEQASSVEEISATITEVAEQTKQNAINANKANELSAKAKNDAQKGNEQMIGMLSAMNAIKESSKNIGSVIKVIDDIAFQTNILALNAAVEAARAGEHGKGFAVVAEEVRNLAARSAKAAKETTDMIDNSIIKVEEGYKIANETAEALAKIVTGVSDAVEIVGMIAEASAQQATAIGQIEDGINQISEVTQSNTATAEETASASEQMAGQAQMLKGLIQEFRLKEDKHKEIIRHQTYKKLDMPQKTETKDIRISLDDDAFGKY